MTLAAATRDAVASAMAGSGLPSAEFFGSLGVSGDQQFAKDWVSLASAAKALNDAHEYPAGTSRVSPISIRESERICDVTVTAIVSSLAPRSLITAPDESGPNGYLGVAGIDLSGNPLLSDSPFFQTAFTVSPLQVLIDAAIILNTFDTSATADEYDQKIRISGGEVSGKQYRLRANLETNLSSPLLPTYADVLNYA
ncbi:hypothetical protein [Lyngbya sp. CCY1209]|uniref:hypothetical protein n=1 Tax=Lyngbya sp. CCY1209 TaxID=2886103 RepID=UPI002D20D63C|nr:hypothetical protein [Lyngbya sp. CCY1209]MEB3884049.1 hypothetical protein [Lyngbya sp. CCY1209]